MESLYNVLLQFKKIYIQREFMKKFQTLSITENR